MDAAGRSVDMEVDLLAVARVGFKRRLELVRADDLTRRTPCTEWDVGQLVNHVVGSDLRYAELLRGGTAEDYLRRKQGETGSDVIGNNPLEHFERAASAFEAALREPGGIQRTVDYPGRPLTGFELLVARIMDITIHTWDLARSLDADDILDDRLVRRCLAAPFFRSRTEGSGSPEGAVSASADLQRRLIEASGRSASWTSSD